LILLTLWISNSSFLSNRSLLDTQTMPATLIQLSIYSFYVLTPWKSIITTLTQKSNTYLTMLLLLLILLWWKKLFKTNDILLLKITRKKKKNSLLILLGTLILQLSPTRTLLNLLFRSMQIWWNQYSTNIWNVSILPSGPKLSRMKNIKQN